MYDIFCRRIKQPYAKNSINLNFNQITAYLANYVTQCEESFIRRKCRPTDDTGGIKNTIDNNLKDLHNLHNNYNNYHPKNTYVEKIKSFLEKYNTKCCKSCKKPTSNILEKDNSKIESENTTQKCNLCKNAKDLFI
jgi:hypothetical protein